jgi:transcription elongation factor GreA
VAAHRNLKDVSGYIDSLLVKDREETVSGRNNILERIQEEKTAAKAAAARGDRSENAEWQTALEILTNLNASLISLNARLDAYDRYNTSYQQSGYAGVGTTVRLSGSALPAEGYVCKLVPEGLGNAGIGAVAETSPVGGALMGRAAGDTVTVNGNSYLIEELV